MFSWEEINNTLKYNLDFIVKFSDEKWKWFFCLQERSTPKIFINQHQHQVFLNIIHDSMNRIEMKERAFFKCLNEWFFWNQGKFFYVNIMWNTFRDNKKDFSIQNSFHKKTQCSSSIRSLKAQTFGDNAVRQEHFKFLNVLGLCVTREGPDNKIWGAAPQPLLHSPNQVESGLQNLSKV